MQDPTKAPRKKSFSYYLLINPKNKLLGWFDGIMMVIIIYSCFTSAIFAGIEFPICNDFIIWAEDVCTVFFILDIILNFMRMPEQSKEPITHSLIFKNYAKSNLFWDVAATIPLYLVQY